jgi:YVTN family beta-propeller protein
VKLLLLVCFCANVFASDYLVAVSNERAGVVSIIDGARVTATINVGRRPRGIQASPDGKFLYVALSGTPIKGPPKIDANGDPIFEKEDPTNSDHSHDGIGVIDIAQQKLLRVIPGGSDPEQFAIAPDGKTLIASNEDMASASIVNLATGAVEATVAVKEEPEGVGLAPDGRVFVTCERKGEICVIDPATGRVISEFRVPGRPRTVAFQGSHAFVPSESKGQIHVVDARSLKTERIIELPKGSRPMGLAVSNDGRKLFATNGRAGSVSVIDIATLQLLKTIPVGKRPWGIAVAPDGKVFVANGPSNDVSVINPDTLAEETRIKVDESPWGVAIARKLAPAL